MTDYQFNKMLISTFTIKRKIRIPDGAGGFSFTWGTIGVGIQGRLSTEPKGSDLVRAYQNPAREIFTLFLKPTTDIARDDMVEGEGKTLRVINVREPSQMNHHLEAICEDLTPSGGV